MMRLSLCVILALAFLLLGLPADRASAQVSSTLKNTNTIKKLYLKEVKNV
jgi:hypothetical protein